MPAATLTTSAELELSVRPVPLAGVKLSRIVVDRTGLVSFAPLYQRSFTATFQASDQAVCAAYGAHPAPNDACACGFYAVYDLDELHRFATPPLAAVFVRARFGGALVEHDFGFRAQFQTVDAFSLPTRCGRCGVHPPVALRPRRIARSMLRELVPVCARCSNRATLPLPVVEAALGVEARPNEDFSRLYPPRPSRTRALVATAAGALVPLVLFRTPLSAAPAALVPLVWATLPRLSLRTRFSIENALSSPILALRFFTASGPKPAPAPTVAPSDEAGHNG